MNLNKLIFALGAMAIASGAMAVTSSNNSGVIGTTASIAASCSVANTSTSNLSFSALDTIDVNNASTSANNSTVAGSFKAICTNGTAAPTFTYTSANGGTTDFHLNGVTTPAQTIVYTLYQSTDSTTNSVAINTPVAYPGFLTNGVQQTLNLSAKILAAAKSGKSVQSYADTITVTVTFNG